jgi:hypothetical protein
MVDITTTLHTAMKRAAAQVLHDIARTGVVALDKILNQVGFAKSQYLKNYEVLGHVISDSVLFEIVLDFDAIEAADEATRLAMEEEQEALQSAAATYGVKSGRAYTRVRDARKPAKDKRTPARDARKPAKDARVSSSDRLLGHEIALHAPRSARITRQGKLSVILKRSIRETENEVKFPQGDFEGVMKDVMDKLNDIIIQSFYPKLQELIDDYVG